MNYLTTIAYSIAILVMTTATSAMADDKGWFWTNKGYCTENNPALFISIARSKGVETTTEDEKVAGQVVATTVTLHNRGNTKPFYFFRGKPRCEAAIDSAGKRQESDRLKKEDEEKSLKGLLEHYK